MAATSTVKPELSALKTPLTAPLSATYPSELRSPADGTPTYIKREDMAMKTPITPPAAYLDFLNKLSPTLASPQSAGAPSSRAFTFEKPLLTSSTSSDSAVTTASSSSSMTSTATASATDPGVTSRPESPSARSYASSSRASSCSFDSKKSDATTSANPSTRPSTGTVPQSPFTRPISARTPRRLHIPQSPYSPASVRSPLSATSIVSPYNSAMSPRDWHGEKEPLSASSTRTVSVRQVVTRTVQYSHRAASKAPIVEPVPASKKRKIDS